MSDFKLKRGEEIIIEIDTEDTSEISISGFQKRNRKSSPLLRPKKKGRYLPRRAAPSGIRFFDLYQTYESFVPGHSLSDAGNLFITYDSVTDEHIADLTAVLEVPIFSVPFENWKSHFNLIKPNKTIARAISVNYTDQSGNLIAAELPDVEAFSSDGVLQLAQSELETLVIQPGSFLFPFDAALHCGEENPQLKITNVRSFDAEPVSFAPGVKMDIYYFPELIYRNAFVTFYDGLHIFTDANGTHSDLIRRLQEMFLVLSVLPREFFDDVIDAYLDIPDAYLQHYAFFQILKQMPDAAGVDGISDFNEFPPYSYFTTWNNLSTGGFPYPTIYTPGGINNDTFVYNLGHGVTFFAPGVPNRLVMMINKGNEWFYFWKV